MSYDSKIFSYNALHNFVKDIDDKDLVVILEVIETRNFEVIMQYLESFSALIRALGGDPALKTRLDVASAKLKESLLNAVKSLHPEHVFKIPDERSKACSKFLKLFLASGGSVYSTNYDLLLYWVLMRNAEIKHVDGCGRQREDDADEFVPAEEMQWSEELFWGVNRDRQNIFYLHGALPFFDNGVAVVKEQYDAYGYLLEKISGRMEKGEYPIFVTAGDGQQKLKHIMHNRYLAHCYESLCSVGGSVVTFGFNFGPYDEHIIEALNRAAKQDLSRRLRSVYISVYSDEDRDHIENIAHKFKCKLHVYDARTAHVWGS